MVPLLCTWLYLDKLRLSCFFCLPVGGISVTGCPPSMFSLYIPKTPYWCWSSLFTLGMLCFTLFIGLRRNVVPCIGFTPNENVLQSNKIPPWLPWSVPRRPGHKYLTKTSITLNVYPHNYRALPQYQVLVLIAVFFCQSSPPKEGIQYIPPHVYHSLVCVFLVSYVVIYMIGLSCSSRVILMNPM